MLHVNLWFEFSLILTQLLIISHNIEYTGGCNTKKQNRTDFKYISDLSPEKFAMTQRDQGWFVFSSNQITP